MNAKNEYPVLKIRFCFSQKKTEPVPLKKPAATVASVFNEDSDVCFY